MEQKPRDIIGFNVGGHKFSTRQATIFRLGKDHLLARMVDQQVPLTYDDDGYIFIDRDGTHFQYILNYLRDGSLEMPSSSAARQLVLREAQYYCLTELVEAIQSQLLVTLELPSHLSVVRTDAEAEAIVTSTQQGRPALHLILSRSNNKFSYIGNPEARFLDNFELFMKLATRFRGRIQFFFETGSRTSDICTWVFYGGGRQLAEVSCASMVYSSTQTQTRVDYPEARILEEGMNLLLHEPGLDEVEEIAHLHFSSKS